MVCNHVSGRFPRMVDVHHTLKEEKVIDLF